MKSHLKTFLMALVILLTISCNSDNKKIQGGWVIDQAYFNDKPVIWNLLSNSFEFNKDHTCLLPVPFEKFKNQAWMYGKWSFFKRNGSFMLQITSSNKIFNKTFTLSNYRTIRDTVGYGMITKATFTADSLKLNCTKAPY